MARRISLHVAFWMTYLFLKTYMGVFLLNYSYFDLDLGTRIIKSLLPELLVLPPKLLMAYSMMYLILPRVPVTNRPRLLSEVALLIAVSLLIYHVLLRYIVFPYVIKESLPDSTFAQGISRFIWRLLDMLAVVATACTFKLLRKQVEDAKKEKQLIQEKLQSELSFLKAQTNPHFLFNTLNSIYALARKNSEQTPGVVMQLSKLLRYMLDECKDQYVALEKEWKVIEDYVAIEKLRYGNRVNISMKQEVGSREVMIAPLIFLPLVENAFKHGAGNNTEQTDISISLQQVDGELNFSIENNFELHGEALRNSPGIGLQNVKRHLELLYPGHRMDIRDRQGKFTVTINLKPHFNGVAVPDH